MTCSVCGGGDAVAMYRDPERGAKSAVDDVCLKCWRSWAYPQVKPALPQLNIELDAWVQRIDVSRAPVPMRLRGVNMLGVVKVVDICLLVPERDTGVLTTIASTVSAHDGIGPKLLIDVKNRLEGGLRHEFCEQFKFDGVRVFDPHQGLRP